MPKYYVESGSLEMTVEAMDARCAALWTLHRTIAQVLPLDSGLPPQLQSTPKSLGATIDLNERGFGKPSTKSYETLDVIAEWSQLLVAVMKLEQLEEAAKKRPPAAATEYRRAGQLNSASYRITDVETHAE